MKKTLLAMIVAMALYSQSLAQTNTFPSSGNVGIGTTTPGEKLTVAGNIQLGGTYPYLSISATAWGSPTYLQGGVDPAGIGAGNYLSFLNPSGNGYSFTQGNVSRMVIDPATGNIGIGTESPVSLFQVDDGCTKASIGDASGSALNYGTSYLGFNASRSGTSWLTNGDGVNNGGGVMYSSIFGDMYFATIPTTGGSGHTLYDNDVVGNIALKISHTDGAVYAKKIYVQLTGFPDYVFKEDYKLMPLTQVKSYIDQNHHLPDMPTDKEVESKGLDVGEMNKLLTKKVEELTLYLIEKDNKEKEQRETNKSQQQQIDELKQQLKSIIAAQQ